MKKIKLVVISIILISSLSAQIRDHRSFAWKLMPGSDGKDVIIDQKGEIRLLNTAGKLYKYEGSAWKEISEPYQKIRAYAANIGRRIKLTSEGDIYIDEKHSYSKPGGSRGWAFGWHVVERGSNAKDFAVSNDSIPWKIDGDGLIYCRKYNWVRVPGSDGSRISAGGGQIWMVNTVGKIYRYKNPKDLNAGWEQMPGSDGRDIAVANDGAIWLVNTSGKIYRWYGNGWTQQPGSDGFRIAANNGIVVLINTIGKIYFGEY